MFFAGLLGSEMCVGDRSLCVGVCGGVWVTVCVRVWVCRYVCMCVCMVSCSRRVGSEKRV